MKNTLTRRSFLEVAGAGAAAWGLQSAQAQGGTALPIDSSGGRDPISDRKVRVGIIGYGVCRYGAEFQFQDHPNVEIVAVSDLFPDRRDALAQACRCAKTYDSLEELIEDDTIEAVFVATDAPQHAKHAIDALNHGKHVAMSTPAVWGSLEEADALFDAVKRTGLKYMLFETSAYQEDLTAMRHIYNAGGFGKVVYCEGEYYHYMPTPIDSYNGWRIGNPPQWYPSHATAYYVCVTGGSFTEVTCEGMPSAIDYMKPENNVYKNPFGTEIALLRTSEGGIARMALSWDTPGPDGITVGRLRGQEGSFFGKYEGLMKPEELPDLNRGPLPAPVVPGADEGTHGYLMNEFVMSILEDRTPLVNVAVALNMTVAGVVAHQSALNDGETMKIPQYAMALGA
ncbi:MAG: Gfo/Idh/MocA family oxidoreductase [Candidatus Hydrogenedentes bacterium]|nr:Gfo/Idh/MocA family oxidoreductase [Candidatus Hydrogenedentota bacterium]